MQTFYKYEEKRNLLNTFFHKTYSNTGLILIPITFYILLNSWDINLNNMITQSFLLFPVDTKDVKKQKMKIISFNQILRNELTLSNL